MKFYTSDWRADPRLKMCSPAARGMWIELICLMHEAAPYGHLLVHGQPPNEAQLASLTGIPSAELPHLMAELERLGVFSRTKEGVIYSRKLVRMAAKSAKARKTGKMGGNPSLGNKTDNSESVKGQDNGRDKTQKPEARDQKKEKEPPDGGSKKKASRLPADWVLPRPWGDWALAEGLPEPAVRREADKFRDYWLAKAGRDGAKLDWQATWRNWVRKALDDAARPVPGRRQSGHPEPGEHRVFFNRTLGVRQVRAWTGVEWSHVEDLEEERG